MKSIKVSKNSKKNFLTFFSSKKKASANMWWIIIGAVIALVVMIILMVMFADKSGKVEQGLLSCESNGGKCTLVKADCINEENRGTWSTSFSCEAGTLGPKGPNPGCCFGVKK
jgi:hypothetical protein